MADAVGFLFIMSFPSLKAKARKGHQLFFSPPFQRWAIRKSWFNLFFYSPTVETEGCKTITHYKIVSHCFIRLIVFCFSPPFQRWAIRKFWFNLFFYSPTVETVCCITIHDHYIISNLRINVLAVFYLAHRFNGGRLGNPGLIYFFIHPRLKPRAVLQFMIIILFQISASMYWLYFI